MRTWRTVSDGHCPQCASDYFHRSRRRGLLDRLLALARLRPYRCGECDLRFYGPLSLKTAVAGKTSNRNASVDWNQINTRLAEKHQK